MDGILARPYAKAAFEYARENQRLSAWLESLHVLAYIAQDSDIKKLLTNPRINAEQITKLFISIAGNIPAGMENFLFLLAENHRIASLPNIAALFAQYYSREEKVLVVDVTSASELNSQQRESLTLSLARHFNKAVDAQYHLNEKLLGGLIIRANDLVIDSSVRGQLEKLAQKLKM